MKKYITETRLVARLALPLIFGVPLLFILYILVAESFKNVINDTAYGYWPMVLILVSAACVLFVIHTKLIKADLKKSIGSEIYMHTGIHYLRNSADIKVVYIGKFQDFLKYEHTDVQNLFKEKWELIKAEFKDSPGSGAKLGAAFVLASPFVALQFNDRSIKFFDMTSMEIFFPFFSINRHLNKLVQQGVVVEVV